MLTEPFLRTFIAVPMPDSVIAELAGSLAELRREAFHGVRWVSPSALHLTVKFLGETPRDNLPVICDLLNRVGRANPSYSLQIEGFGAFPNTRRPRVLWTGFHPPPPPHFSLVEAIESAMKSIGFNRESRPHSAHITVARIPGHWTDPWPSRDIFVNLFDNIPPFIVNKIVLIESTLSSQGAKYSRLHEAAVGGGKDSGGITDG
ncbi:RNA 2',3'-cyclic phosphodiesterase [bacterium]|nr:RNA 2',3'-cyclic phosphodiesterase [candidate division CSSED10-310 bacterium]